MLKGSLRVTMHLSRPTAGAAPPTPAGSKWAGATPEKSAVARQGSSGNFEQYRVELHRPTGDADYGFGVGEAPSGKKLVIKVSGAPAAGQLQVGDMIVSVNQYDAASLADDHLIAMMCTGLVLELVVQRRAGATAR